MRILHFSDVHIGVESYGSTDPDTGLSTRLMDFLATFDEVVDFALDNSVDLVLFAGDAYKSRDPSQTHQREFARRIARLSREGVPVFLLVGNHDLPHIASRATALDIFPTLSVPNVTIGDRLDTYIVDTTAGPLQVVALPWIRRSAFLAQGGDSQPHHRRDKPAAPGTGDQPPGLAGAEPRPVAAGSADRPRLP